jgi:hypothetical protein
MFYQGGNGFAPVDRVVYGQRCWKMGGEHLESPVLNEKLGLVLETGP